MRGRMLGVCIALMFSASVQESLAIENGTYSISRCRYIKPRKDDDKKSYPVFRESNGNVVLLPFLRVGIRASVRTFGGKLFAKAYFYDQRGCRVAVENAWPIYRGKSQREFPTFLQKGQEEFVYIPVPDKCRTNTRALLVFGDDEDMCVYEWPNKQLKWKNLDFDEKQFVINDRSARIEDDIDAVDEYVFKTKIDSHPTISYYVKKPKGVDTYSAAKGVLAVCLLANRVDQVRDTLRCAEYNDDLTGILAYAEDRKLILVGWGAWVYWDPYANWNENGSISARKIAALAKECATEWCRGMKAVSEKFHFPQCKYLICGFSGAAQFSVRLAMNRPDMFKAVYVHIPSSFPKPLASANNVLWCLTTGEEEVGYHRSIDFLECALKSGFPIVYKAIPRLGHAASPKADKICYAFFDYAIGLTKPMSEIRYGDVFRQIIVDSNVSKNTQGLYVPLWTEELCNAW